MSISAIFAACFPAAAMLLPACIDKRPPEAGREKCLNQAKKAAYCEKKR